MKSTWRQGTLGLAIAASLGATSGMAHAQSSVTLYGVLDAAVLYTNKSLNTRTGANDGHKFAMVDGAAAASRFGLRGVEDLGGGMKATFVLESGIDIPSGALGNSNGNLFGRQAWIGLSGNFGAVKAGLQYSPFVLSLIGTDPRDVAYFGSGAVIYVDSVLVTGLFNQNAVSYTARTSPASRVARCSDWAEGGRFPGGAAVFGEPQVPARRIPRHGGALQRQRGRHAGDADSQHRPFTGRTIGAAYSVGNLTVKGSYALYKVSGGFDSRVYGAGASYLFTPAVEADAGAWLTSDGNDTGNRSVLTAIGLRYFLSKATTVYGQVGVVHNHGLMNTGPRSTARCTRARNDRRDGGRPSSYVLGGSLRRRGADGVPGGVPAGRVRCAQDGSGAAIRIR